MTQPYWTQVVHALVAADRLRAEELTGHWAASHGSLCADEDDVEPALEEFELRDFRNAPDRLLNPERHP